MSVRLSVCLSINTASQTASCCCVFWPAYRCCAQPKAGWNTFFCHFQTFIHLNNCLLRMLCISTSKRVLCTLFAGQNYLFQSSNENWWNYMSKKNSSSCFRVPAMHEPGSKFIKYLANFQVLEAPKSWSKYTAINPSIHPSIHLFVHLSIHLFVHLFVCLSVCVYLYVSNGLFCCSWYWWFYLDKIEVSNFFLKNTFDGWQIYFSAIFLLLKTIT